MSNSLYELGGVPVDLNAVRVVLRGEHYIPGKRCAQVLFDVQPPMTTRSVDGNVRTEDFEGQRIGRLIVVGYWGKTGGGSAGQKWVCRCACGMYVIRKAKTIKAARDPDDKCEHCRHLEFLKTTALQPAPKGERE